LRLEEDGSHRILCLPFRMLPAVELDYQPCFEAHEIDDIGADDLLPPEFEAEELTVAQMLPEQSLSIGLLDTQSARAVSSLPKIVRSPHPQFVGMRRNSAQPILAPLPHHRSLRSSALDSAV
jgi:hypothetical protein